MCGRFSQAQIAELDREIARLLEAPPLEPRYNVAPTQDAAVVRERPDGDRVVQVLRWGLIPRWAKDPAIGNRMINARAETAAEKPAFKSPFQRHRCLVPADGFYEWQKSGGAKQPYFIRRTDGRPLLLAGWAPIIADRGRARQPVGGRGAPLATSSSSLACTSSMVIRSITPGRSILVVQGISATGLPRNRSEASA